MALVIDRLPAGPGATLEAARLGGGPGPRVAVLGGVHGDELEGVLAAQRLIGVLGARPLNGTVTVLPLANPPALAAGTRTGADGENLARVFPGAPDGTLSARIAHTIGGALIAGCDLLVDLHSAGRRYRMPPLCGLPAGGTIGGRPLLEVARATAFPFLWAHGSVAPGRSVSHAEALGKPWVYFECGGGGALREHDIDRYVTSVLRLLAEVGVLGPEPSAGPAPRQVVVRDGDGNTDDGVVLRSSGLLVTRCAAGDAVAAGQVLGTVHGRDGAVLETVRAATGGYVMMLRHDFEVAAGDVAAIVAGTGGGAAGTGDDGAA